MTSKIDRSVRRAFTLVEMLVVLGIIALVMSMSIPMFVPMTRQGKLDSATDTVKSACLLARSKAIQERRPYSVTLFQAERAIVLNDYEVLRASGAPAKFPPQIPYAPNSLDNYLPGPGTPEDRWDVISGSAAERIRYLPEGCNFYFGPSTEFPVWTYVFLPNGSAWTLPRGAGNDRNTWSVTTHMVNGKPSGPKIFGPGGYEDASNPGLILGSDFVEIVVYATTGQPISK